MERKELLETYTLMRMIVSDLRLFLDTEDYGYLRRAYRLCEKAWGDGRRAGEVAGLRDLYNNMKSMYERGEAQGWRLSDEEHAELSHQASYTLMRANIIAAGLSFRLKRMRP